MHSCIHLFTMRSMCCVASSHILIICKRHWINHPTTLYNSSCHYVRMSTPTLVNRLNTKEDSKVPKMAIAVLAGILLFGMFVVGYDQGQLAQALVAPMGIHLNHGQIMLIHEFNHDLRHAAGFPCH